jgi:hypothetical protein
MIHSERITRLPSEHRFRAGLVPPRSKAAECGASRAVERLSERYQALDSERIPWLHGRLRVMYQNGVSGASEPPHQAHCFREIGREVRGWMMQHRGPHE